MVLPWHRGQHHDVALCAGQHHDVVPGQHHGVARECGVCCLLTRAIDIAQKSDIPSFELKLFSILCCANN